METESRLMCIEDKLDKHSQQLDKLETGLAQLSTESKDTAQTLGELSKETRELLDIFRSLTGAFRVLQLVAKGLVPLTAVAGFLVALITLVRTWRGWPWQ